MAISSKNNPVFAIMDFYALDKKTAPKAPKEEVIASFYA